MLNIENGDFCLSQHITIRKNMHMNEINLESFDLKTYFVNEKNTSDYLSKRPFTFGENKWLIIVRFIESKLKEVYFTVNSPKILAMTDDEYYNSGDYRLKFHRQMLEKLCKKPHKFAWGKVSARLQPQDTGTYISIDYK